MTPRAFLPHPKITQEAAQLRLALNYQIQKRIPYFNTD